MASSYAIKLIAFYALFYWSAASFAHENQAQTRPGGSAELAEQRDWGIAGDAKAIRRTITIRMRDTMRFTPANIQVRQGETVRLIVKNSGKLLHELVIGSKEALAEHAAQMLKFPEMEHDEPDIAHVGAGKTGQLVWKFNRAGDFEFACLIPGHYQVGMKGSIRVIATQSRVTRSEKLTQLSADSSSLYQTYP